MVSPHPAFSSANATAILPIVKIHNNKANTVFSELGTYTKPQENSEGTIKDLPTFATPIAKDGRGSRPQAM
jgi:hypothetical protein